MAKFYIWKYLIITIGHSHSHPWWIALFPSRELVHQLGGKQTSLHPFLALRVGIPFGKIVVLDYYYPGVILIMLMIFWWDRWFGSLSLGAPVSSRSRAGGKEVGAEWNSSMKEVIKTLEYVISSKIKAFNGLSIRNGGRGLIRQLLKLVRTVLPRLTKSGVVQVVIFTFFLSKLIRHSGSKGAVLYLKTCQVLLQQSVAGYRVSDLAELKMRAKRTRSGLPRVIPAGARRLIIRDRNIRVIRLWMTLFGIFRIMEFKGSLNLSTITDPGLDIDNVVDEFRRFLRDYFIPKLKERIRIPKIPALSLFPILKSGPTSVDSLVSSSPYSMVYAARLILRYPKIKESFLRISSSLGYPGFINKMELVAMSEHRELDLGLRQARILAQSKSKVEHSFTFASLYSLAPIGTAYIGKLGFKIEPAGKVRVFAMVDPWTQWLLAPIHKFIFAILRQLRTVDGTFNQLKPIERLRASLTGVKKYSIFSIDLSAATDRLPIKLQVVLLEELLSLVLPSCKAKELAVAWSNLLVGRYYKVSVSPDVRKSCNVPSDIPKSVLYSVGQPMGALSSWAMLAITHHAVIHFAAWRINIKSWFTSYGVLGDDMTIVGKAATSYRLLLSQIGVKAGLAKSIIARNKFVVEFAKKFFVDDTRADMVPFKEAIATWTSTALIIEFVRKYNLSLNQILAFLGYGYKARSWVHTKRLFELGTRLRVLIVWLSCPNSPLGRSSWLSWLEMINFSSSHERIPLHVYSSIQPLVIALVNKKLETAMESLKRYEDSVERVSNELNKKAPIELASSSLPGSAVELSHKSLISWLNIFSPDLGEEGVIRTDLDKMGRSEYEPFGSLTTASVDIELDDAVQHHAEVQDGWGLDYEYEDEAMARCALEPLIRWVFAPHPLKDCIPKEYWQDSRSEDREFRDFLDTYRVWQNLSRPIWANYYKNLLDKPGIIQEIRSEAIEGGVFETTDDCKSSNNEPIVIAGYLPAPRYIKPQVFSFTFTSNYGLVWRRQLIWSIWITFTSSYLVSLISLWLYDLSRVETVLDLVGADMDSIHATVEGEPQHHIETGAGNRYMWLVVASAVIIIGALLVLTPGSPPASDAGMIPLWLPELVGENPNLIRLADREILSNLVLEEIPRSPMMMRGYWE